MRNVTKTSRRKSKAQSLVEIALCMPFLGFAFLGLIDLGRAFYVFIALHDAAANSAQYAGAHHNYTSSTNTGSGVSLKDIQQEAIVELYNSSALIMADSTHIPTSGITMSYVTYSTDASGNAIEVSNACPDPCNPPINSHIVVTISYKYDLLTPFIQQMAHGGQMNIQATSSAVAVGN